MLIITSKHALLFLEVWQLPANHAAHLKLHCRENMSRKYQIIPVCVWLLLQTAFIKGNNQKTTSPVLVAPLRRKNNVNNKPWVNIDAGALLMIVLQEITPWHTTYMQSQTANNTRIEVSVVVLMKFSLARFPRWTANPQMSPILFIVSNINIELRHTSFDFWYHLMTESRIT